MSTSGAATEPAIRLTSSDSRIAIGMWHATKMNGLNPPQREAVACVDRPMLVQYAEWLMSALRGDFGSSVADLASELAKQMGYGNPN